MNIKDPETHPNFKYFEGIGEEFNSLLDIPLNIATQCIGVLVIQSDISERFPDSVVDMANSISTQLANLVLNTSVLDSLSEDTQQQLEKEISTLLTYKQIEGVAGNTCIAIGKTYIFKAKNRLKTSMPPYI